MSTIERLDRRAVISVRGVVQGVGFRPFIYRLATRHHLRGWVRNTSGNVEIEVEGKESEVKDFLNNLKIEAPPQARIEQIQVVLSPTKGYKDFRIYESESQEGKYQLVSPDIATCPDCRQEIFDRADRRFHYPFTNCTNCGPRFTIIEDIPYDRPKTTMRDFVMCPQCEKEYHDPLDRRFHAQPNACPVCGPQLELVSADGKKVDCPDIIHKASQLLKKGKILAIRGLGGFQLACDATNPDVVNLLRQRKHRPAKPFAVMLATLAEVKKYCIVSEEEAFVLESPESPIVLVSWSKSKSDIVTEVAPNLNYLGMMLPYTPLHHLLLKEANIPLVMTSGNLSEEPIAKDNDEALIRLKDIADYFLLHNRGIYARYDDSVFIVEDKQPVALRRARGYAPYPLILPYNSKQILACGAELKNTFCLTRDNHAFLSQHIGDMENEETLEHFENTIELYKRLFRIEPEMIACDLHPDYLPSKYAMTLAGEKKLPLVTVQHHHSHIVSCLAENKVEGPVIGVAFDGVGYGTDGAIWGGEFLVADWRGFKRVGQFEYVPMPGGASAIKKPYRMALGYIYSLLGDWILPDSLMPSLNPAEIGIIKKQIQQKVNCPLTSSVGRLFDAVAAIAGIRQEIDYEAQAAIELEMLAPDSIDVNRLRVYPCGIEMESDLRIIRLGELFRAVIKDVMDKVNVPEISAKLHNTVARITTRMCQDIAKETGLQQVALSGGVFQNRLLLRLTRRQLEKAGFQVFTHHLVPCNDGGIALGQAVIAHHVK
ncbi:MAG TPA: carbamoyltransferase HypF [Dehalococcoidales bacterium]